MSVMTTESVSEEWPWLKSTKNFEELSESQLNSLLSKFYMDCRTKEGELYKVSSLTNFRNSLKRYLQAPPHNKSFDIVIVHDEAFRSANLSFTAAVSELKACGKGSVEHYPMISDSDREKIYKSRWLDINGPTGLYNKVQFDVRLYFCRRGGENMANMTKDTFLVKRDPDTQVR